MGVDRLPVEHSHDIHRLVHEKFRAHFLVLLDYDPDFVLYFSAQTGLAFCDRGLCQRFRKHNKKIDESHHNFDHLLDRIFALVSKPIGLRSKIE